MNEKTVSGPRGLFEGNVFKNSARYIKAYTAMDMKRQTDPYGKAMKRIKQKIYI